MMFKRALYLAPTLCNVCLKSKMATFATVAVLMLPTSTCGAVPPRDKKNDDEKGDDLIKKLTENLPENVRDNAALFLASSGSSLKSAFESGVPAQVKCRRSLEIDCNFDIRSFVLILLFGFYTNPKLTTFRL